MRFLAIKNFDQYQHYRDRRPPWIKLHQTVLDDYAFCALPDESKAHLMLLWLLASRMDNRIPVDEAYIARMIGALEPINLTVLWESGFIVDADEVEEDTTPAWASRYVPKDVRARVMEKANATCQQAGCGSTDHLEIDHIVPISKGGTSDEANLQVLCRKCNRRKRVSLRSDSAEQVATQMRSPEERRGEGKAEEKQSRSRKRETTASEPANWVGRITATWGAEVGDVQPGYVGKKLKAAHDLYGEADLALAMRLWIAKRRSDGRPMRFSWFADEVAEYVRMATRLREAPVVDGWMSPELELLTRPRAVA